MDFLEQFKALLLSQPKTIPGQENINSDYAVFLYRGKNCYMCYGSSYLEDCYYIYTSTNCKDCTDSTVLRECELCYEGIDLNNCYNCDYCQDCLNSTDLKFCYDCMSCNDCFGCVGLRHKKYHIFNEQYDSRSDYLKKSNEVKEMSIEEIYEKLEKLQLRTPRIAFHGKGNQNSFGDYVYNSKNCYMVFDVKKCQDCYYLYDEVLNDKDCVDCSHIHNSELCYDCMTIDFAYSCNHCFWLTNSSDCDYCYMVFGCKHCFGCVHVRQKEYYILNQPYEKEEYFAKVAEIKKDLAAKGLAGENLLYLALKNIE